MLTLTSPVAALSHGDSWRGAADDLLANLGFTLINSQEPAASGSHLLVALREMPTLRHFDPEIVTFFAPRAGRGTVASIDRGSTTTDSERPVLWGHVHVIDRLRVENRFLTFGGTLRTARVDPERTLVDLWSPGPIARWGGHSQGADQLSALIGAFFGRLMVPVDFEPGAEGELDAQPADVLYAAFLLDFGRRFEATERLMTREHSPVEVWLLAERSRLARDADVWSRAGRLATVLGLAPRA